MFRFKQFSIQQENSPFKVGTDSVILGSWATVKGDESILDIGTGTGVLALMMAQKAHSGRVLAIEPERAAYLIAEENVENSPFASRTVVVNEPLQRIETKDRFDLIISNPPYFINSTKNSNDSSTRARHTEELTFEEIIEFTKNHLSSAGRLCVVLPINEALLFEKLALSKELYKSKELLVSSFDNAPVKRICLEFSTKELQCATERIFIRNTRDKQYSIAYRLLTQDFHTHY